jgi:tetratricopeptide (TPR) repeat protein
MKLKPLGLAFCLVCPPAVAADSPAFISARTQFEMGRFEAAQRSFGKLEADEPENADVHYYLGQLALERDDAEAAVAELQKTIALSPDSARGHNALGDAYGRSAQQAGMFSKFGLARKCLAEYQRALEIEPNNVDYHESLFGFCINAPSIVGGGEDNAAKEAAVIKKLDPERGHRAFATLYTADRKFDLSIAELDEILRAKPDDYGALYQEGRIAVLSGEHLDQGLASLRHSLDLPVPAHDPPHSAALWRIGNILEKKGDRAGARAAYEAALKIDPAFAEASEALKNLR